MNRCDFEPDHGLAGPIARIPDQGLSHTCASVRVSLPQIWAASTTTRVLRRARRHQAAHQEHTRATKYKTTPEALVGGAATAPAPTAASTRWATTAMAAGAWRASVGRRGSATGEAGRGVGARSRAARLQLSRTSGGSAGRSANEQGASVPSVARPASDPAAAGAGTIRPGSAAEADARTCTAALPRPATLTPRRHHPSGRTRSFVMSR